MKSNILIYQYDKEKVQGTNSDKEFKNYFLSKMMEIEDSIIIDDISIQYADVTSFDNTNGFQYYNYNNISEEIKIKNLSELKNENNKIELQYQSDIDLENNTKWSIKINCKKILQEYLYLKIKEKRTFKCITYKDLNGIDVNTYLRNYILNNTLNRYKFDKIDLYIQYVDLFTDNTIYSDIKLKYNPEFKRNVMDNANLVKNVNIQQLNNILYLDNMTILYNQIKNSSQYKINYYFNLYFSKI